MIEKNIQQVYYTVSGAGEPVLFIHGLGEDGRVWDGIRQELEKEFTVIVPDLPGSGRSAELVAETSMEVLAESLKLIVENEHIPRCAMIGHSMGGYVMLAFVEKFPGIVSRDRAFSFHLLP